MAFKKLQIQYLYCIICNFNLLNAINLQYNDIWTIIEEFKIDNPYVVMNSNYKNVKFLKQLCMSGHYTNIYSNINDIRVTKHIDQNLIIFSYGLQNFANEIEPILSNKKITVVVIPDKIDNLFNTLNVQINQQVYFYETSTQQMYEKYIINQINVQKNLGKIQSNTFIWEDKINHNWIKRRQNFHGLTLKAMVEFSGYELQANKKYIENAPYYPNNDTYLINGYIYGLINDVFETLETQLNFTTLLYKRNKNWGWGDMKIQPNGTLHGTAIVGKKWKKILKVL